MYWLCCSLFLFITISPSLSERYNNLKCHAIIPFKYVRSCVYCACETIAGKSITKSRKKHSALPICFVIGSYGWMVYWICEDHVGDLGECGPRNSYVQPIWNTVNGLMSLWNATLRHLPFISHSIMCEVTNMAVQYIRRTLITKHRITERYFYKFLLQNYLLGFLRSKVKVITWWSSVMWCYRPPYCEM